MTTQDEVKVYKPEVIEDAPFPTGYTEGVDDSVSQTTGTNDNRVYSQATTKEQAFPRKKVAVELIGQSINTKSQKIIKTFEFTEHGAIQIGKYVHGVSGEVKVSPQGIIAKNKDGIETFLIYGETGDAVFRGTVQTGSLISGDIVIGGSSDGEGTLRVADAQGNVIVEANSTGLNIYDGKLNIYNADGDVTIDQRGVVSNKNFNAVVTTGDSLNFLIDNNTAEEVTGSSDTFNLAYPTLMIFKARFDVYPYIFDGSNYCIGKIDLLLDGNIIQGAYIGSRGSSPVGLQNSLTTTSLIEMRSVAAGDHTVKIQCYRDNGLQTVVGNPSISIYNFELQYMAFGPGLTT